MSRIAKLISGGQSGADRGAMDAAAAAGVEVGGWCPAGGWAEDLPDPPGVLALYPQMRQTPSSGTAQRTEWNIRDSTCCIVLNAARGTSPGTDLGFALYEKYGTPHFEIELDGPGAAGGAGADPIEAQVERACEWLQGMDDDAITVSFGGPRASEYPGVYGIAYRVVTAILEKMA